MYCHCDRLWGELTLGSVIFQSVFFPLQEPVRRIAERDEQDWRGGRDGVGFEVRSLRFFELRTSDRTFLARLVLRAPRSVAHGKRRVSARRGRAGEKSDFFSILIGGYW